MLQSATKKVATIKNGIVVTDGIKSWNQQHENYYQRKQMLKQANQKLMLVDEIAATGKKKLEPRNQKTTTG